MVYISGAELPRWSWKGGYQMGVVFVVCLKLVMKNGCVLGLDAG